jgi:hypothetical protein
LADDVVTPKTKTEPPPEDKKLVPVANTDFTELFNTDPDDFEWSTPTTKETLV